MKYIGFTTKYYTLWEVTQDFKYTYYKYVKNLSIDFEKAKMKEPTAMIDLTLRGHSSFKKENDYTKVSCFQFGKYKGEPYADCTDFDYMAWYHNFADSENIKSHVRPFLVQNGYKLWNGERMVTNEQYERNSFLKSKLPTFKAKLDKNEPFKFKCEKNVIGRMREDDSLYGELNVPFCKLIFYSVVPKEYNGATYYLPTINGEEQRIKNRLVCIDDYDWKQIDDLTFEIQVFMWHTEWI